MSTGYALRKVVFKTALPGIVTGLLLAMAIAGGETAPLLYTAGFANTLPHSLTHASFPYLTYVVLSSTTHPNAVPLPGLRRCADPRGDRAAPARIEPRHRVPDPTARRGSPRHSPQEALAASVP